MLWFQTVDPKKGISSGLLFTQIALSDLSVFHFSKSIFLYYPIVDGNSLSLKKRKKSWDTVRVWEETRPKVKKVWKEKFNILGKYVY